MPLPVDSGLILQLDCPDLAMGRHHAYAKLSEQEFLGLAAANVAALNAATEGLPAERLRTENIHDTRKIDDYRLDYGGKCRQLW